MADRSFRARRFVFFQALQLIRNIESRSPIFRRGRSRTIGTATAILNWKRFSRSVEADESMQSVLVTVE